MRNDVLTVVGGGSMGEAIVRRCGSGSRVVIGDVDEAAAQASARRLGHLGFDVTPRRVDVADAESVKALADDVAQIGPVTRVVHTAGLSPVQAPADAVVAVDLLGVAHSLGAFGGVIAPGGAAVVISSMAGHLVPPLPAEDEAAIRGASVDDLAGLECVRTAAAGDAGSAYALAKLAVRILVERASLAWGRRGARVNSISPGVIATPMGQAELAGESGDFMRMMVDASGTGRQGTPDDIATATEFLLGAGSSFVTGTDLLVDGGVVAAVRSGALS